MLPICFMLSLVALTHLFINGFFLLLKKLNFLFKNINKEEIFLISLPATVSTLVCILVFFLFGFSL